MEFKEWWEIQKTAFTDHPKGVQLTLKLISKMAWNAAQSSSRDSVPLCGQCGERHTQELPCKGQSK